MADEKKPPVKTLRALEKVFAAEVDGRLPLQSQAKIYRDLLAAGLVIDMVRTYGEGWTRLTVIGYGLTDAGRLLYCANC